MCRMILDSTLGGKVWRGCIQRLVRVNVDVADRSVAVSRCWHIAGNFFLLAWNGEQACRKSVGDAEAAG